MKIMVTSFKRSMHVLPHTVLLTLQQTTADPCFCQSHHQSHPQLGVVFLLAPSLHSFWSVFLHCSPVAYWAPTNLGGLHWKLLDTHGQVGVSLLWGSLLLSPGSWCAQGFVCALQEPVSPVLCTFWRLYGGVNGDLLQKGLCHAQVCCTQSP